MDGPDRKFTEVLQALSKLRDTIGNADLSALPVPPAEEYSKDCEGPSQSYVEPIHLPVTDREPRKSTIRCMEGDRDGGRGPCTDKIFANWHAFKQHIKKYHSDKSTEAMFCKSDKGKQVAIGEAYKGMLEEEEATVLCR